MYFFLEFVSLLRRYYSGKRIPDIGTYPLVLCFFVIKEGVIIMAYAALMKSGMRSEAETDNRITALYVRVSTGYQVDKDSLPFQKKELENYCKHVLHIESDKIEIFEDAGKSGKNMNRPGFERMMKKVRFGQVARVVVYKIDRITRNLVDFSLMYDDFKYNRVTFISLNEQFDTSSAIGEAVLKIILVFAELERKLTSERVRDVMIGRALSGQWNGARMPYGWDWDSEAKCPKHHNVEAVYARMMYDMYEDTHSSCRVRDYCNSHNIPTKRGGEWTSKTVSDFIRNPMNKGDYRYNYRESARGRKKPENEVVYVKGAFPPLVTPAQWNLCNRIMDENNANKRNQGFSHKRKHCHIFSSLIVCGKCGANFQAVKKDKMRANGFAPSIYRCGAKFRKKACDATGCSDVLLGDFIFNYISSMIYAFANRRRIATPTDLEKVLLHDPALENVSCIDSDGLLDTFSLLFGHTGDATYGASLVTATVSDNSEIEELRQRVVKLNRALERLKKAYLFSDNAMSEEEYLSTKHSLEAENITTENKLKNLSESQFESSVSEIDFIKSSSSFLLSHKIRSGDHIVYSDFAAAIDDKTLQEFVHMVIEKIVVLDGRPTEITFKNGLTHKFTYKN